MSGIPSVLKRICDRRKEQIKQQRQSVSVTELEQRISDRGDRPRSLRAALELVAEESSFGVISEFKRSSPSAGPIFADADVADVITAYSKAGATGISVLTEPTDFGGSLQDFDLARANTSAPMLRKDFVVDPYMIYEARAHGADVILLIAAALSKVEMADYADLAHEFGLDVLVEVHSISELDHVDLSRTDILGVNNRNLHTLVTDIQTSHEIRQQLPGGVTLISESGLRTAENLAGLVRVGYKGFLIGEHLMRTGAPGAALCELLGKTKQLLSEV